MSTGFCVCPRCPSTSTCSSVRQPCSHSRFLSGGLRTASAKPVSSWSPWAAHNCNLLSQPVSSTSTWLRHLLPCALLGRGGRTFAALLSMACRHWVPAVPGVVSAAAAWPHVDLHGSASSYSPLACQLLQACACPGCRKCGESSFPTSHRPGMWSPMQLPSRARTPSGSACPVSFAAACEMVQICTNCLCWQGSNFAPQPEQVSAERVNLL